jgi:putative phage-type endonuclease
MLSPNEHLESLRQRELSGEQKSDEWLRRRHNFITASAVAACAGLAGESSRMNVLLEKASYGQYSHFAGGYYTDKGNIFETVTNSIYCQRNSTEIHEFGLIPHKEVPFLGASTDGVTSSLVNIEIKTLAGREIDGKIKKEYYHQTQLQMECLGLQMTDFLEAKYQELAGPEEFYQTFYDTHLNIEQGIIMEYWNAAGGCVEYLYSPCSVHMYTDEQAIRDWHDHCDAAMCQDEQRIHVRDIYWRLTDFSCTRVNREPAWAEMHLPKLREFWQEVERLRANPMELARAITLRENQRSRRREARGKQAGLDIGVCML